MPHHEAVKEAQAWARKEADKFIHDQGEKAKELLRQSEQAPDQLRKRDLREAALYEFGKGAHTLMDNTSPAHRDFTGVQGADESGSDKERSGGSG